MSMPKRLVDSLSPGSWVFIYIAVILDFTFLLRPTLIELLVMVGVDLVAFSFFRAIDSSLFQAMNPDSKLFFDGIDEKAVAKMGTSEKIALYQAMGRFPSRRAIYGYFVSFIKGLPAAAVVIWYWEYEISMLGQAATFFGICALNFCYFMGALFIESHFFVSQKLRELHQKFDFSDAFEGAPLVYSSKEFRLQESAVLVFLVLFMLGLQLVIVVTKQYHSQGELAFKLALIGGISILLFGRIWYMGRQFFIGGLERIFNSLGEVDYRSPYAVLSLHTSPLLAQFEKTYNKLTRRLMVSERELSSLIFQEADKSRYRALGEMSALVAHDLSGPLHAAQFYTAELLENGETPKKESHLRKISSSVQRALELTLSLRARVKNPSVNLDEGSLVARFMDAHQYVLNLLEVQFHEKGFHRIKISVDWDLAEVSLRVPQADLVHILDNLYRNALENMLRSAVNNPTLKIVLLRPKPGNLDSDEVNILIEDTGTGLDAARFEELTGYLYRQPDFTKVQNGLGLRLTRRLVELHQGALRVIDQEGKQGARLVLTLKRSVPTTSVSLRSLSPRDSYAVSREATLDS